MMNGDLVTTKDTVTIVKSGNEILSIVVHNQKTHRAELYQCRPMTADEVSEIITQKLIHTQNENIPKMESVGNR